MRHENVYQEIFEQVQINLAEEFSGGNAPDDRTFEDACYSALEQAASGRGVAVDHLGKHKFPDITLEYEVDGEKIGVEVKLHTSGESWTTFGNSAYSSTQEPGLETIFLLFGNFEQQPPAFAIKPYANCIKDIKPTHSPRYMIDMRETTDFCERQIGISFDQLRNMSEDDRIIYVNTYIARTKYEELTAVAEKTQLVAKGFVLFPELFSHNPQIRYRRMSVWLFANNILCRNVRDFISASGTAAISVVGTQALPKIYTSLLRCVPTFKEEMEHTEEIVLKNAWGECGNTKEIPTSVEERIDLWLDIVSQQYGGKQKAIQGTPYKFKATLKKIIGV